MLSKGRLGVDQSFSLAEGNFRLAPTNRDDSVLISTNRDTPP